MTAALYVLLAAFCVVIIMDVSTRSYAEEPFLAEGEPGGEGEGEACQRCVLRGSNFRHGSLSSCTLRCAAM